MDNVLVSVSVSVLVFIALPHGRYISAANPHVFADTTGLCSITSSIFRQVVYISYSYTGSRLECFLHLHCTLSTHIAIMSSQTSHSPEIFSPRPTALSKPFDMAMRNCCGTVKQDIFSYVVSSDGIEVCHPQVTPMGDPVEDRSSPSEIQDAKIEAVVASVENLSTFSDFLDAVNLSLVREKPSLGRRRGRCPAKLDLDRESSDEDSWTAKASWCNGGTWSDRSRRSQTDRLRPRGYTPIAKEYEAIKQIGNDSEGVCTLVKGRTDSQLRVIKTVQYPKIVHGKPIEAKILHDLLGKRHENIIQLHGYDILEEIHLVQYHFEYCSGGDLHDLIVRYDDHNARFPEPFIWKVFHQLMSALEYLHRGFDQRTNNGIVHRDVKPENVFVRRSQYSMEYPDVVLADFGSASLDFATHEPAGTYFWQPPEIPRKAPKGDVYAVGSIIHFMIHLTTPMLPLPSGVAPTERNEDIWELKPDSRQPIRTIPKMYSPDLIVLMLWAVEREECKRMSSRWLLRAIKNAMDQEMPLVAGKVVVAEPLAVWAFDEDSASREDSGYRRCSEDDDGYRQYIEMMGDTY